MHYGSKDFSKNGRPTIMPKRKGVRRYCFSFNGTGSFITPPSGQGIVIPIFYLGEGGGGHLPQTSARPQNTLSVIFVCLAFIRQHFHESWCRKSLAIEWRKIPSTRARMKMLTSFENHRFDLVLFPTRPEPAKKQG